MLRFGNVIRLSESGPIIPSGALWTIGVSDNSKCWGLWLDPGDGDRGDGQGLNDIDNRHLLITPIDPESWPYVFRMQIRLSHAEGSLCRASEVFSKHRVNILSARATTSGHSHATWNVIGEALKLKEEMRGIHQEVKSFRASIDKKRRAALIMESLLAFLPFFVGKLEAEHRATPFLRSRFLRERLGSYEKEFFGNPVIWRDNQHNLSKAISYSIMPNLAHFFRHAAGLDHPLTFHYDESSRTLVADSAEDFKSELVSKGFDIPARAIASFDTVEHYVRLDLLSKRRAQGTIEFDVQYRKNLAADGGVVDSTSLGLLRDVAGEISACGVNLLHVRNSVESRSSKSEVGSLKFIGEVSPATDLEHFGEELQARLVRVAESRLEVDVSGTRSLALSRVFISMSSDLDRGAIIRDAVRRRIRKIGFEAVEASSSPRAVTADVVQKIRGCKGLIQVLGARMDDGDDSFSDGKDFSWLIAEYFGALMISVRTLRFADSAVMSEKEWRHKLKIDLDSPLFMYDSSESDGQVRSLLSPVIDEFLADF